MTTVRSGATIRAMCVIIATAVPAASGLAAPTVKASVDRTRVAENETITLTVSVAGADSVSDPDVSVLREFDILGSYRSRSMSISGAGRVSEMVYSYTLRPRQTGELTIPALDVPVDRANLRTDAISITVVPTGGGTPRPGGPAGSFPGDTDVEESDTAPGFDANSDVVIKCETDKQRAYVGEQILLTFSLYSATALNSADYQPANTEGFRTQALPPPDRHYEVISGRRFIVQEELKLLFPTARGEHVVGPATLNFATSYWDPVPKVLQTEPITIEVLRVPEAGRPESFTGVVGELAVDTLLDRDRLKQGEAATLTVVVSGWGNLEAMEAPTIALPPGLREYQSSESREFAPQVADDGYRVQGEAVFDSVIIPTTVGDVQIPEVEVAYFSPVTERYETARSLPAVLHVEPGDAAALEIETPGMAGIKLKPLPDRLRGRPRDRVFSAPFMLVILVAALWLLATVVVHRRRAALAANPKLARARTAAYRANAALRDARRADPTEAAAAVASVISGYVADRLDIPPATVSAASARGILAGCGVSDELAAEAASLLRACDQLRFAPDAGVQAAVTAADAASGLIRNLDRSLRRRPVGRGEGEAP